MAMALYPSVQKQVQDEIDRVVGRDRLPTFDDRASLPHVDAVLRETLRWRLIAPLAIPHTAVKDNIYKGFYIPKGEHMIAYKMPSFLSHPLQARWSCQMRGRFPQSHRLYFLM
jgi:cytochrome P450